MGRRPIGRKAMTGAQRQKRLRLKKKREATGAEKRAKREARLESMRAPTTQATAQLESMPPLYGVIYADPPWRFEPWSRITGMDRAADNHYPTMGLDEIKALPIPAAPDCVLFLCATAAMLPEALE